MAGSPGAISTGSLRMTGNARHGFGGWADSLPGWTMKRAWTRRWTALRLIWSSISTLPDCSDLRNDQCSQTEKADQNAVRDAGELQRPTDIGGVKFGAAAFAHETGFDRLAVITARADQGDTQGSRHSRFGPAGIRRAMVSGIAAIGVDGIAGRSPVDEACRDDEKGTAEAGCGKVDEIVEAGGRPAESFVARRPGADHAVEIGRAHV